MGALASSAEEARELLIEEFEKHFWEDPLRMSISFMERDDPDALSAYNVALNLTVEDLKGTPIETKVLFINGSE
jgi:hypothetical protein